MDDLKEKVVLVTGSSGGIGEEIIKQFASLGSKVVVTGRSVERVEKVANECNQLSPYNYKPLAVVCDLIIESDVEHLVNKVIETFGKLDALVNNAAFDKQNSFEDENLLRDFDQQINVNIRSVMHLCRLTLPHLIKTKGSIINISAIPKPILCYFNSSLTNCALDMLTKVLALEFGPKGVRVNSVSPSAVNTKSLKSVDNYEELYAMLAKKNALRRLIEPEEIAKTVAFLASDCASFITGTSLPMDAGELLL